MCAVATEGKWTEFIFAMRSLLLEKARSAWRIDGLPLHEEERDMKTKQEIMIPFPSLRKGLNHCSLEAAVRVQRIGCTSEPLGEGRCRLSHETEKERADPRCKWRGFYVLPSRASALSMKSAVLLAGHPFPIEPSPLQSRWTRRLDI